MRFLGVLAALGLGLSSLSSTSKDWKTYTNVRFRYAICYPSGLLQAQPEAPNSDGRSFLGNNGEKMLVYGSERLGQSLAAQEAQDSLDMTNKQGAVAYEKHTRNWFVISGHSGTTTFYVKTYVSGDQFKSFRLTYPSSEAATYDPVASRVSHCFVDLASRP